MFWLCSPFVTNYIAWLPPPASLEQFLRTNWGAVSQAAVLVLPQIKLNLQLSNCVYFLLLLLLSLFSHVRLCATPEMAAHQAPPSLGFSRQEHGSGLPFPSPMHESEKWKWSHSVMSDSSRPHGLQPTRLLHPWDFPGKSTGVGCQGLLRIFFSWHYNLQGKVWNPKCYENWYFIDNSFDGKV